VGADVKPRVIDFALLNLEVRADEVRRRTPISEGHGVPLAEIGNASRKPQADCCVDQERATALTRYEFDTDGVNRRVPWVRVVCVVNSGASRNASAP
jgi:hypothetical protein